ncbi:MAG: thioesterase domain-containing protein, partial [Crocinitomicaceae bacterium]|nr:thioesterase domain-containing protein [Crocinitomicaceae bacterium]
MFLIPGIDGNVMSFRKLGEYYTDNQIVSFLPIDSEGSVIQVDSIQELARIYVDDVVRSLDGSKIIIGGYSFGVLVAYEMIMLLQKMEINVEHFVILERDAPETSIDPNEKTYSRTEKLSNIVSIFGNYIGKSLNVEPAYFAERTEKEQIQLVQEILIQNELEIELNQL